MVATSTKLLISAGVAAVAIFFLWYYKPGRKP